MNHIQAILDSIKKETLPDGQLPGPTAAHLAFIPQRQRSNALVMCSQAPSDVQKVMPTIFIGTTRENYDINLWQQDIDKWKLHFQEILKADQHYLEVQLLPLPEAQQILNSTDAILKMESALESINSLKPGEMIRIVCLGTGYSNFLYEAITYLLKEWTELSGELRKDKHLQFITSGDTGNRDLSDFCQWLCISGTCQCISFYDTMKYHPFGYAQCQYQPRK